MMYVKRWEGNYFRYIQQIDPIKTSVVGGELDQNIGLWSI